MKPTRVSHQAPSAAQGAPASSHHRRAARRVRTVSCIALGVALSTACTSDDKQGSGAPSNDMSSSPTQVDTTGALGTLTTPEPSQTAGGPQVAPADSSSPASGVPTGGPSSEPTTSPTESTGAGGESGMQPSLPSENGEGGGGGLTDLEGGSSGSFNDPSALPDSGIEMPEGASMEAGAPPEEEPAMSAGCGSAPTLSNSTSPTMYNYNTVMSGGVARRYVLRFPENYDNTQPHQLVIGFHGFGNTPANIAGNPAFLGLYELSEGSTIFIAPEAVDQSWSVTTDIVFVDDLLEQVKTDLCIDPARIIVQGFSQGGAMVRALVCERPGVFRAAIAHSAGGIATPATCEPIPFLGSLGLQESGGSGQLGQTEVFANAAGCIVDTLPSAPTGGHACTEYEGCADGYPVVWCSYDGGHTPLPNDAGQNSSWMPATVWEFISQLD